MTALPESPLRSACIVLRVAEIFCGLGGFRIGLSGAANSDIRFEFVYAHDLSSKVKTIYDANFANSPQLTCAPVPDISTIPEHDILFVGMDGQTQDILPTVYDIIRIKQPRWIILENIKKNTKTSIQSIETQIRNLRYMTITTVLDMSKISHIPQSRERLYIIACREVSNLSSFVIPTGRIHPPLTIPSLLQPPTVIHDKYYYFPGKTIYTLLHNSITTTNKLYQFRRYYVRENKTERCPTLTANMGRGGHNVPILRDTKGIRKLTPRECLSFQGFPETYQIPAGIADCHSYTFIGGAIAPPLIQRIGEQICVAETTSKPPL
jgi:DNA (cytosine-5)-methyltransferase 1